MANEDIYADLRRQALGWMVLLISAGTWISLLVADAVSGSLCVEWVGRAVAIVSLCAVLNRLRANHLILACYLAVTCLWSSNILLSFYLPNHFLYLFGLVIVLSSSLIKPMVSVFLAASTTSRPLNFRLKQGVYAF